MNENGIMELSQEPAEAVMPSPEERGAAALTENGGASVGDGTERRISVETSVSITGQPPEDELYGEFEWPDGYVADAEALARFVSLARDFGLSKERAQALASLYAELDITRTRKQEEFIERNNAEWLTEIQGHPEFGGARLESTGRDVAALLRRYGSPELVTQMRQMHIQNWPEMFYFLARISRDTSEDCSPLSASGRTGAVKSTAQLLFPDLR